MVVNHLFATLIEAIKIRSYQLYYIMYSYTNRQAKIKSSVKGNLHHHAYDGAYKDAFNVVYFFVGKFFNKY